MDITASLNWDNIRYLLELARSGSAVNAATSLKVSHQTVARHITELERALNIRLVDRSHTPWTLTEMGKSVLNNAEEIEKQVYKIATQTRVKTNEISGRIRITSAADGFDLLLMTAIAELQQNYPKLEFDLVADYTAQDISSGSFDIALRFTNTPPEHLIGRKVGVIKFGIYGLKHKITQYENISNPETKNSVPFVIMSTPHITREIAVRKIVSPQTPTCQVSSLTTLTSALRNGMGIGILPVAIGTQYPDLHKSADAHPIAPLDAWLLRNLDSRSSLKIKTVEKTLYHHAAAILKMN
ncbi:MAG: LysR family transcriptional regulator [Rhizobiales bacterium]|nr:LysR family transcriptional regulator [Hyphomicrobiales bacterium]NRB15939.1 LysR family transcriptional regulator [Hyphomicrobiales bacterium]